MRSLPCWQALNRCVCWMKSQRWVKGNRHEIFEGGIGLFLFVLPMLSIAADSHQELEYLVSECYHHHILICLWLVMWHCSNINVHVNSPCTKYHSNIFSIHHNLLLLNTLLSWGKRHIDMEQPCQTFSKWKSRHFAFRDVEWISENQLKQDYHSTITHFHQ